MIATDTARFDGLDLCHFCSSKRRIHIRTIPALHLLPIGAPRFHAVCRPGEGLSPRAHALTAAHHAQRLIGCPAARSAAHVNPASLPASAAAFQRPPARGDDHWPLLTASNTAEREADRPPNLLNVARRRSSALSSSVSRRSVGGADAPGSSVALRTRRERNRR